MWLSVKQTYLKGANLKCVLQITATLGFSSLCVFLSSIFSSLSGIVSSRYHTDDQGVRMELNITVCMCCSDVLRHTLREGVDLDLR